MHNGNSNPPVHIPVYSQVWKVFPLQNQPEQNEGMKPCIYINMEIRTITEKRKKEKKGKGK